MVGFGGKKQILIVGNDGVQLYVVSGKRVSLYADFSDAGGSLGSSLRTAFKAVNAPLIILFDVLEQQYRKESIPKVSTFDKNKVIQRKLMMAFPQQQFRAFIPLKQKPKENEGLVALFAGLSSSLTITQVIDAILSSEVTVEGAGLLPMESTQLVSKLVEATHKRAKTANDTRWSILMTHHKTGGLRQVIIKDGELALTRLTPLAVNAHDTRALTDEMVREFNATLTYLARFGYIASDGLDLIVISSPDVAQAMRDYRLAVTHLYPLSVHEAGQLIGLTPMVNMDTGIYGEIIHAGWAGIQRKLLMPLSAEIMNKVTQARQGARLGILLLLMGACYFGWQAFNLQTEIIGLNSDIAGQKAQRVALQNQYDDMSKKLNVLKYDPEKTRVILGVYDDYKKKSIDFEPTLNAINSQIDKESIVLQKIEVTVLEGVFAAEAPPAAPPPPMPPQPMSTETATPMAPVEVAPPKANVTIDLKIGFADTVSTETAARLTNDLVEKLKARLPGRQVEIAEMIGNLSVDQTVQGISEQVAQDKIEGRMAEGQTSSLRIKGAVE